MEGQGREGKRGMFKTEACEPYPRPFSTSCRLFFSTRRVEKNSPGVAHTDSKTCSPTGTGEDKCSQGDHSISTFSDGTIRHSSPHHPATKTTGERAPNNL